MKNYIYTALASLLLIGGLTSCSDFLDKEVDLTVSEEKVFEDITSTRGFLANIYTYLPDEFAGIGASDSGQYQATFRDSFTDNSTSFWSVHYHHAVLNDSYTANNHFFALQYWEADLKGIRACNKFMTLADENVIGNAEKDGDDNKLYDRYIAEARYIRALLTFDMIGWFGAVPLMVDEDNEPLIFQSGDTDGMNMTRTAAADALQWVADECDAVKDVLPFRYADENSNWGRVNGAAAYALKSRALLYKASPLNNTSSVSSWWSDAAQAAVDFITVNNKQSNPYKLYTIATAQSIVDSSMGDYYNCFVSTPHLNDEFILSRSEWTTYSPEIYLTPCGFSGSVNSVGRTNPTQNLVDSYETINGLPYDADPTYDEQNPYVNRDPRLDQTIFHHGSYWGDASQEEYRMVNTSTTGADYQELHGGTTTGYYCKKYCNNMSFKNPTTYVHACPIFRYAEILLNAAEAYANAGDYTKAISYAQQVRDRVGMPQWTGTYATGSALIERIQNERRVELCFENHRFFDERRWKLFEGVTVSNELSKPRYQQVRNIYSAVITADEDGSNASYVYQNDNVHPTRAFTSPKNYLFPLPNDEVKKAPNLKQNSGWELSSTDEDE